MSSNRKPEKFLGVITKGSLGKGLQVRIRTHLSLERIQTGQFVAIECEGVRFFGLLTDISLEATTDSILLDPPDEDTSSLVREVLHGVFTFGDAHVDNRLALYEGEAAPRPVRSVPSHFTPVYIAEENDFDQVFGSENLAEGGTSFAIGKPLDMEIDICLDLEKFVERSNGIFGKSGTGKSVLTRLILAGLIRGNICSNLIFDMHNEYGEGSQAENKSGFMKGLKPLFGSRVMVWAVRDQRPGSNGHHAPARVATDGELIIGMNQIEVEDILLLRQELDLNQTAAESAYLLRDKLGENWISNLLKMDSDEVREIAERTGANVQSVSALKRKLEAIRRLPFVEESWKLTNLKDIVENLARGKHVIVQFGSSDSLLGYMLVANILTRLLHDEYRQKVEKYNRTRNVADKPRRVMITIEEAHKFLTPEVAGQTIFGTIAREMRKYFVTLLVVDQRPSSIDSEVMSQIGTRIVALINDERDIEAVFTGVSGSSGLKTVLSSLDSRQQALLLGHAAPMPVVLRTRPYDEAFYKQITAGMGAFSSSVSWEDLSEEEQEEKILEEEKDLYG